MLVKRCGLRRERQTKTTELKRDYAQRVHVKCVETLMPQHEWWDTGGVYVSLVMQVANPSDGISYENLRKCGGCVVNRHMWNNGGCNKTLKMHIALQNFGLHGRT